MKNTAYAFAQDHLDGSIEDYAPGARAALPRAPAGRVATVNVREHAVEPDRRRRLPAPDAFVRTARGPGSRRSGRCAAGATIEAGVEDLVVMKTTRSAFSGFERDRYTDPARDRRPADGHQGHGHLALRLAGHGRRRDLRGGPRDPPRDLRGPREPVVQTSIWIMGRAMLERHDEVEEVRMVLPNLHHWPVDLRASGSTTTGDVFMPTTEPHGLIEATVRRSQA